MPDDVVGSLALPSATKLTQKLVMTHEKKHVRPTEVRLVGGSARITETPIEQDTSMHSLGLS